MRKAVKADERAIDAELKSLEAQVNDISQLRALASDIAGSEITSLTGEEEVHAKLSLKDYPAAPKEIAAELLGVKSKYSAYKTLLSSLIGLDNYELSKGRVVLKKQVLERVREVNTVYLEGDRLALWQKLEKAAELINEIGKPIASQVLSIERSGKATLNLPAFLMSSRP